MRPAHIGTYALPLRGGLVGDRPGGVGPLPCEGMGRERLGPVMVCPAGWSEIGDGGNDVFSDEFQRADDQLVIAGDVADHDLFEAECSVVS